MRSGVTTAYQWLALLIVAGGVVQFLLAGAGVFGAESFDPHESFGWILHTAAILVVIGAIVGPRTRRAIGMAVVFFVVFTIQVILPGTQDDSPWLAAFHPVLALAVLGLASNIGMPALSRRRGASAPRPAR
jgi:peptidoglycan/LPS O-acetylase OafA/YrhL